MVFVIITQELIQNWYLNKVDQGIKRTRGARKLTNGREPKSCLGRVFNFKLGCFARCVQFMAYTNMDESRLENSAQVSSC